MNLNRELYLKVITDALGTLSYQVDYRNTINLYDINIISEDFFKSLLNKIFGYNLVNLNIIEKNASAIDLGDRIKKIAIQVTSDNTSTKIKNTIEKFIEYKLYDYYDTLIILIITRKKSYTSIFETQGIFDFNSNKHIIDCKDIIKHLNEDSTVNLKAISDFLQEELINKVNIEKRKQASEIDTIIDLIEYLSKNKKNLPRKPESIVDPEYKINTRFMEYATFLKGLYVQLAILYDSAVHEANGILGLDDIKELLISTYLMDISNQFLEKFNGNAKEALEELVCYFSVELSRTGKTYDKMAIKYYLISQTIKCNVFPNMQEVVL